ncbi:MAG: methionine--tRNA ligase [Planctomycetes bacterium]|nr:methionine--tRNA ligase [Planctomycetota bacterium]
MTGRFTVTAALPYSNGRLHVGHMAGCYLPADTFVRYLRSRGEEVAFICGSDDYGVPVSLTARKEGRTPREVADFYRAEQKRDFDGLGIEFDIYSGTSATELHTERSQQIFLSLLENGFLEKRSCEQLYDPEAQMFLPDRYVEGICPFCDTGGARGDQCEACGKLLEPRLLIRPLSVITGAEPEMRRTVHWHFKLSEFKDRLREWIESHDEWRPMVRNFSLGLLEQDLPARAITRDLQWGVPVPLPDDPDAEGKVLYVWFDAPIGYVSFTAQWCREQGGEAEDYTRWWKDPDSKIIHFIGEDNVVFHAVVWPAVLMGEGTFQLPDNIPANCFLNIQFPGKEEEKMSTSRGTAIWIKDYLERYQPDPLRYYLTMVAPERQRTAFNFEDLARRNNEELVAALGNFVHRNMTFADRYFDGRAPRRGDLSQQDKEQLDMIAGLPQKVGCLMEDYRFKDALHEVMAAARLSNKYFDHRQPWALRKVDMETCGSVINVCLNTVKTLAVVMAPFLPFAARKAAAMLRAGEDEMRWSAAAEPLPEGRELGEPEILFEKMELPEQQEG